MPKYVKKPKTITQKQGVVVDESGRMIVDQRNNERQCAVFPTQRDAREFYDVEAGERVVRVTLTYPVKP